MQVWTVLLSVVAIVAGCAGDRRPVATLRTVFGPVVGNETISGRADDASGAVWLMVGGTSLVRVDLAARVARTVALPSCSADPCWGLARLLDKTMWALDGRNGLIQIGEDGQLLRAAAAPAAHLNLFGLGDSLILQHTNLPSGTSAMVISHPGDPQPQPWGAMTVRLFTGLSVGAAAAMNLVACGTSQRNELPCWFPDEPEISLIAANGATKRVVLEGLPRPSADALINATAPPRPIRDAFVERDGTIWILSSGSPPPKANLQGGWLLCRYSPRGEPIDRRSLPEAVRMIFQAHAGTAVVLTAAGMVAEVLP